MLIWLMGLRFECMDELRDGKDCNYFKRVVFFQLRPLPGSLFLKAKEYQVCQQFSSFTQ